MNLVRIALVALSVLLPTVWTVAKAADEPPPSGDTSTKKSSKKSKKGSKKGEGGEGEKKSEPDTTK
jgi:hypothetical protein